MWRHGTLPALGAALFVLLSTCSVLRAPADAPAPAASCARPADIIPRAPQWRFVRYIPSAWEREWTAWANSDEFVRLMRIEPDGLHVCARMRRPREMAKARQAAEFVGRRMPGGASWNLSAWLEGPVYVPRTEAMEPLWTRDTAEHRVMSKLVYAIEDGQGGEMEVAAFIEPLVGHLRHPYHCSATGVMAGHLTLDVHGVLDTSYLILDRRTDPSKGSDGVPVPPRPRAALYFDLGATLFPDPSAEADIWGSSQGWFPGMYRSLGIPFSSMTMWEASEHKPGEVFANVPAEVLGGYQYFNVPVARIPAPEPWAAKDGMEYNAIAALRGKLDELRRMLGTDRATMPGGEHRGVTGSPEVYVVFKLDIDTASIENPLAARLLELLPRGNASSGGGLEVHEFFFEHHTNIFDVIGPLWCIPRESCRPLADSYALFKAFRERGVRAHAWV